MSEATGERSGMERTEGRSSTIRRLMPLAALVIVATGIYASGLHRYLSFDALSEHRETLLALVEDRPILAPLGFVALYAVTTALSLPGGVILTLAGGFLFGTWLGGTYVVVGATLGAITIFLIAKTALGDTLRNKAGPWMTRMESGFRENELSYMLILRLVPLFPFWLVNLVPAFLGVSLPVYAAATFVGIIPGSFAYASAGNGLGSVFDRGEVPGLEILADPTVWGPMAALAVLAMLPIVYKRFLRKKIE